MIVSRSSNTATYGEVTENFRTDVENTLTFKAFSLFKPSTPKVINFKFHTCKFFFRISLLEIFCDDAFFNVSGTKFHLSVPFFVKANYISYATFWRFLYYAQVH